MVVESRAYCMWWQNSCIFVDIEVLGLILKLLSKKRVLNYPLRHPFHSFHFQKWLHTDLYVVRRHILIEPANHAA